MTSSVTFTVCLPQFELVYCSVSLRQKRWRLFYGYADDCLALSTACNVPWFATQLPEIHFPGTPDDFPCCSHFAICCPYTTVTRHGSFGEMERESPFFFLHSVSPLSASEAIIFHVLESFRVCNTENSSCAYNGCCQRCNIVSSTQKKKKKKKRGMTRIQARTWDKKHSPVRSIITSGTLQLRLGSLFLYIIKKEAAALAAEESLWMQGATRTNEVENQLLT